MLIDDVVLISLEFESTSESALGNRGFELRIDFIIAV